MKVSLSPILVAAALALALGHAAAEEERCPVEQVVATVLSVEGKPGAVHLKPARPAVETKDDGQTTEPPVAVETRICYGDRLEVGPEAVVTLETTKGRRHIGGSFDPLFQAPQASEQVSSAAGSYLASLYRNIFRKSGLTVYATGRGFEDCQLAVEEKAPLLPLDRLSDTSQRIGADLQAIVAAWKPAIQPRTVRATLRGKDGTAIAESKTCGDAHVALRLRPGDLHPNDVLTLEVADDQGQKLSYHISVVAPDQLPDPPTPLADDWLIAAWRLAAGPPETRLDSISRLQFAPRDALAARKISEAVWADSKF